MHGHMAFWGAYAMIVLAIITYALPNLTGRRLYDAASAQIAFWCSNVGMIAMTLAFAVAGVAQVYLERRLGMDFIVVQKEIEVHFIGLILAASLFTLGVGAFILNFIRYGRPVGEVLAAGAAAVPAGRFGTPAEFGALCAYLCSVQAGYIAGQNLLIDGGNYPGTF
jgi:nitric oxide reductase subunit B